MSTTNWVRYTPHALVATVVFEFMHVADELAGNWAPFTPMNDPLVATISMGIFTLIGLGALWGVTTDRFWGYGTAATFGLFFLVVEFWHLADTANMTPFRWSVVILAQLSAALVVILSVAGLWNHKPWQ